MFKLFKASYSLIALLLLGAFSYQTELFEFLNVGHASATSAEADRVRLSRKGNEAAKRIQDPFTRLERKGKIQSIREHKVSRGQTLGRIWQKLGDSQLSAQSAFAALKDMHQGAEKIRSGELLTIGLDSEGEIIGMRRKLDDLRTAVLTKDGSGSFDSKMISADTIKRSVKKTGIIRQSLAASAYEVGIPFPIIDQMVDLFADEVDFQRDIQPGDSFVVSYDEEVTRDGKFIAAGPVHAALLINSDQPVVAVRWEDKRGVERYYDQDGELRGSYFLRYPVKYSRISSAFSYSRLHPVLKIRRPHLGVDFAAPTGTPIRSVADGIISYAARKGGAGNMIKIKHGSRYETMYLHLSRFAKGLRSGSHVQRGQVIGYVGSTGLSTGPHLDYRIKKDGKYVNPLKVELPKLPQDSERIPARELERQLLELGDGQSERHQFAQRLSASGQA